jgi:hypothetical protein
VTLDLYETGVALMRQNLRRRQPNATDEETDHRLAASHQLPGAELGDAAWAEELEKRIAAIDAGTMKLEPWNDVKRRIFAEMLRR